MLTHSKVDILKFASKDGAYNRMASQFRNTVSSESGALFAPEINRCHLYMSRFGGAHWHMDDKGWRFSTEEEVADKSAIAGTLDHLRFTVALLWDKKEQTIVNNESSEMIWMLNTEFNSVIEPKYRDVDIYLKELRSQIDELNCWIYYTIKNDVYKAGFATKQHLDKLEALLKDNITKDQKNKFLTGVTLDKADIRLYSTLVRFDAVYHQHFKCNIKMLRHDYPYIHDWLRLLYRKISGF
ncbi:hypothetical protein METBISCDRAFT_31965 [Metschnikowia bicuspidata]|uniref:GST C-terminal domain-containing protein n=1 Tax=Metschnikowia bicuspidata TaxID=27322 RepID=A0A4P9Z8H5_9ASCO|nr:hypothetical protein METBISCDRAFT_31965 [Metschnikowia bicuspidata]